MSCMLYIGAIIFGLAFLQSCDRASPYVQFEHIWGLTRGNGMSERLWAIWFLLMLVTAEVNRAMQYFTGTKYQTSDQHNNTAQARIIRDHSDGLKILQYLQERDPFTAEENLINLATGEVVD